ncbi:twin-arginine translocase subunit TatC [Kamptonema cortianum]|nr:twin-arginine translocase subunit TatC [Geitlerinema splendidum]MDK3161031.1 twin-arginine translocase subunit TatC [Kamptonema cortianum]
MADGREQLVRNSPEKSEELRMTLGEHLEELRQRIIKIVLIVAVGMIAGWYLAPMVYRLIDDQVIASLPEGIKYQSAFDSVTTAFMFQLRQSVTIGLILTLPLTVIQLWGFIAPGLKPSERRPFQIIVPISVLLFFLGSYLGWLILPPTLNWFAGFNAGYPGTQIIQNPAEIIAFCTRMMLAFGLGFQLPIIVFFLVRLGVVQPNFFTRYWRHASLGVVLGAAILTPSGDPFSLMILSLPLIILLFGSVYAAKMTLKPRDKQDDELNNLD